MTTDPIGTPYGIARVVEAAAPRQWCMVESRMQWCMVESRMQILTTIHMLFGCELDYNLRIHRMISLIRGYDGSESAYTSTPKSVK